MPSLRIPLVGSYTNRNPNASDGDTADQKFTNCFPEVIKNAITGKTDIWLNKRQGYVAGSDVQASATGEQGAMAWTTATTEKMAFAFKKSTLASIMFFDQNAQQIGGDIVGTRSCIWVAETSISGTGNLTTTLQDSALGNYELWYYPDGGAWTQVTSGNFPSNFCSPHTHKDGYCFALTFDGKLFNSDLNSMANWSANNYITVTGGGQGIGVAKYRDYIVAFTDYTLEFFYNAGNAGGSVLSRVNGGIHRIGCLRNAATLPYFRLVGDSLYWVGQNQDSGKRGVYRLNGAAPEKISTPEIDKLVENATMQYILGSFDLLGMTHIVFLGTTHYWCYCVDSGVWWAYLNGDGRQLRAFAGGVVAGLQSIGYVINSFDAKIYKYDTRNPVWTDNTSTYTMSVRTDNMDLGTQKKKYFRSIVPIGDSQGSSAPLSISYSDNDYGSFSTANTVDLSTYPIGKITRLGASRRRAWNVTNSSATACRLQSLEVVYDVGIS